MTQNAINNKTVMLQYVSGSLGTLVTCSTTMPFDNTIPQITEGTQVITLAITPKSSTSTLLITCSLGIVKDSNSGDVSIALFQDSTANALTAQGGHYGTSQGRSCYLRYLMTSGTTSSTTFKIRVGPGTNVAYVAGDNGGTQVMGGVYATKLDILEYK